MKIKVDLSEKHLINVIDLDDSFPLITIRRMMEVVGWRYYDSEETPTIDRIKGMVLYLLKVSKSSNNVDCGGFSVSHNNGNFYLKFYIATHIFSSKSTEWDGGDLICFKEFINRLESIYYLLTSPLLLLTTREDKEAFFKRKCNEFIDSGDDYFYDKELQYSISKIDNGDGLPFVYELKFIGFDKDYCIL